MTPLAEWLRLYLPPALVWPVLALIYALALLAILLASGTPMADLAYIDAGHDG